MMDVIHVRVHGERGRVQGSSGSVQMALGEIIKEGVGGGEEIGRVKEFSTD